MTEINYRLLSQDEIQQVSDQFGNPGIIGVAVTGSGEVVSLVSFKTTFSGTMCDNCVGNCVIGGSVWTKPSYQEQGIYTKLFYFTKEAAGIKRIYIHDPSPAGRLVADRYGFAIPKNIDQFPAVINYASESQQDEDKATFIEGIL